jgi:hypothetical protein
VLTAQQLRWAGITRAVARRHVMARRWIVPLRGTVAPVAQAELAADGQWLAARRSHALQCSAAAVLNRRHVVAGRSGAILLGLPTMQVPARASFVVPHNHPVQRAGACRSHLRPSEVTTWFGIPCTSAARTVVDVARSDRSDGLMAADAALHERLVTRAQLQSALADAEGRPGVRQARGVLALASAKAESPLESLTRLALHDDGLPPPQLQVGIFAPGRSRPYRVDMLWRAERVIVEVDGRSKYTGDELWREKRREDALRDLGYRVVRVTWSDLIHEWPATSARIRSALARATPPA